jgi:hypothetical protein
MEVVRDNIINEYNAIENQRSTSYHSTEYIDDRKSRLNNTTTTLNNTTINNVSNNNIQINNTNLKRKPKDDNKEEAKKIKKNKIKK